MRRFLDSVQRPRWRPRLATDTLRPSALIAWISRIALIALSASCGASEPRFPLREPFARDLDLKPVQLPCRTDDDDPSLVSCAPEEYVSPLAWDGADNSIFRPLSGVFAVDPGGEAINVNALDEVPDSAWFQNRLGQHHPSLDELKRGACSPELMLDPGGASPGSWLIDQGKANGASLGFRVRTADGKKYMLKNDAPGQPERATAASAIGAAVYHAVGYNTSCEQIVLFDRKLLQLSPGLTVTDNSGLTRPFDPAALDHVLSEANRRGPLYRMQASAWLSGYLIGPFRYEGTRSDDPNDVIAHEDRRELRGGRLVAAWLNHFDAREQNSMDVWIASDPEHKRSSPGFVRHYILDTSDCLGSEWAWDAVSRRLGRSYLLDWGDLAFDFVTFGTVQRSWEHVRRKPGFEMFGYFDAEHFEPDAWKNEYPNPAFSRASERDNAWMARILSRFDRADIDALVQLGKFSQPEHAAYLSEVLEQRLRRILARYLRVLSPVADVHVEGPARMCATDLARRRQLLPDAAFSYRAVMSTRDQRWSLRVETAERGKVCVPLPRLPIMPEVAPNAAARYVKVVLHDTAARYPLRIYLYDLGPEQGYRLAGLERLEH